jgi:hypothetical protein
MAGRFSAALFSTASPASCALADAFQPRLRVPYSFFNVEEVGLPPQRALSVGRRTANIVPEQGAMMVKIAYLSPSSELPVERHVAVVIHRDNRGAEKGYFYDTADGDSKGSGPFDWNMEEAVERAERFATDKGLALVTVRAQLP